MTHKLDRPIIHMILNVIYVAPCDPACLENMINSLVSVVAGHGGLLWFDLLAYLLALSE